MSRLRLVRGEGTLLWDADGNEYLDFLGGIAVVSIGHCHPALVEAISEQAARLIHVGNLFYTEPAMRLARRLSAGTRPAPGPLACVLRERQRATRLRNRSVRSTYVWMVARLLPAERSSDS